MKAKTGGRVFKDSQGGLVCGRINQTDIPETVQWLEQLVGVEFPREHWLGSTGRRVSSGDIDLALDAQQHSSDDIYKRLVHWAQSHGLDHREWIKKSGQTIYVKTPIQGRPDQGYVQTDLMFLDNMPWATWAWSAAENSNYSGTERNILINSIAKSLGYKLNANAGIQDRETQAVISDDPDAAAKLLLNPRATVQDLTSVESIMDALEQDPDRDAKLADARRHFDDQMQSFTEDVQADTEINYLARLRDRIVNQGMYVLIEARAIAEPQNIGGSAKSIEHVEDLIFRRGVAGAQQALDILRAAAHKPSTVTVKWDGSPAVIFGRSPDTGEFVLTDLGAWSSRTQSGMFTSVRALIQDLAQRDARARERGARADRVEKLAPIYRKLWPELEAAWPEDLLGFVQGDLLYSPDRAWQEHAGYLEFRPNEVRYRIPMSSDLGEQIFNSHTGIALHTQYADQDSPRQPVSDKVMSMLRPVPGLLLIPPQNPESLIIPRDLKQQVQALIAQHGPAIRHLLDPVELRRQKITDFASLAVKYINSRVGQNFDNLAQDFLPWLETQVTANKLRNITQYLQNPAQNNLALDQAFAIWLALHDLKMAVLSQLDQQHPGQEGWVFSTDQGYAKAVNRLPGGFADRNRQRNTVKT